MDDDGTIYNWQYCLSVSACTSTILNVTQMHRHKFAETSIHIGSDELFLIFSFFADCQKRNKQCMNHWAMVLSFCNMAQVIANNQQCITNNLGFQLGGTTFTCYKSTNCQRIIAGQNVMLKNVQFGNFDVTTTIEYLKKTTCNRGKQSNGFTGIIFPVPSIPQATTDHLHRIQAQQT
jgi:hypothetical protein